MGIAAMADFCRLIGVCRYITPFEELRPSLTTTLSKTVDQGPLWIIDTFCKNQTIPPLPYHCALWLRLVHIIGGIGCDDLHNCTGVTCSVGLLLLLQFKCYFCCQILVTCNNHQSKFGIALESDLCQSRRIMLLENGSVGRVLSYFCITFIGWELTCIHFRELLVYFLFDFELAGNTTASLPSDSFLMGWEFRLVNWLWLDFVN